VLYDVSYDYGHADDAERMFGNGVAVVRSSGGASRGGGVRGVVAEIDARLAHIDTELAGYEGLVAERERLRNVRSTLLGEEGPGRISQDDVAGFLGEHPGSRAKEIADALGVPLARVSAHLYRAKHTRFVNREDGWHLREQKSAKGAS
jgi:hypothetical protein